MKKYSYGMLHLAFHIPVKHLDMKRILHASAYPGLEMEESQDCGSVICRLKGTTFEIPKVNFHVLIVEDPKNEAKKK